MNAVLLAAGMGTRLRPLTNDIPKCMVPICGKPLLDYWLEMLTENSHIDRIFINVCYLEEVVVSHLEAKWKTCTKLVIWREKDLLGTAGTLRENASLLTNKDTLVIHADNLSKFDLNAFIQAHKKRPPSSQATMMLFRTQYPKECGIVERDINNIVLKMHEKVEEPPGDLANAAVYILTPAIIDWIKKNKASDISLEVIPYLEGKMYSWINEIYHRDIGTPKSYKLAQEEFLAFIP